jgi:Superfamily II DNA helicase
LSNIYLFRGYASTTTIEKLPFREAFGQIGQIRSFCGEKVPFLALSATMESDYSSMIMEACNLSRSVKVIHSCADRKNIRLSIVKIKSKSIQCFKWLFSLLKKEGTACPKVLIYCRTKLLVSWLFFTVHFSIKRKGVQGRHQTSR